MSTDPRMPEVEPLSERRWDAIERRVLQRSAEVVATATPQRTPAPWARALAISAAVVAAVAAGAVGTRMFQPAATESARVITGSDGARTNAGDVTVEVAAFSSVLVVPRSDGGWLVVLDHGRARFLVPPRAGRPPFVVDAGETRVEVVGTRFSVERAAGARTAIVEVEHGVVRVTNDATMELLRAGQRSRSAAEARNDATAPTGDVDRARPSPAVIPATHPAEVERSDPPSHPASPRIRPAPSETDDAVVVEPAADVPVTTAEPAQDSPPLPPAPPPDPDRASYLEAQRIEATDSANALRLYAVVAAHRGRWGALALFAQARLELELHHAPRARELLNRYLTEYPDGLNVADARSLLRDIP